MRKTVIDLHIFFPLASTITSKLSPDLHKISTSHKILAGHLAFKIDFFNYVHVPLNNNKKPAKPLRFSQHVSLFKFFSVVEKPYGIYL